MTLDDTPGPGLVGSLASRNSIASLDDALMVVASDHDERARASRVFHEDFDLAEPDSFDRARRLLERRTFAALVVEHTDERRLVPLLDAADTNQPDAARIFLTRDERVDDAVQAVKEGTVDEYLSSPWRASELRLAVERAVERRSARRERAEIEEDYRQARQLLEKANERLDQLEQLKSVFTKIVSHEVNTPVATALGYAELLDRELDDISPSAEKALDGLESSAARLKSLSRQLFKLLADDGPAARLAAEPVAPDEFVDRVRARIAPFLDRRGQSLEVDVDEQLDEFRADSSKLEDIATNLLMNAIKFSRDGQPVRMTLSRDRDDVLLVVEDEGVGIDEQDRERIFEPFFSTFDSEHHSSGEFRFGKRGMGLGLTVARQFAELHGGGIRVDSEPGEGARFTVRIPPEPG